MDTIDKDNRNSFSRMPSNVSNMSKTVIKETTGDREGVEVNEGKQVDVKPSRTKLKKESVVKKSVKVMSPINEAKMNNLQRGKPSSNDRKFNKTHTIVENSFINSSATKNKGKKCLK